MKIRFRVLNSDTLYDYREACNITQGIDLYDEPIKNPPKDMFRFWVKAIVANHSVIRSAHIRMTAEAPRSVIMQVIRATKEHPQPYVQSSRPDWNNGKERSSDPYEEKKFIIDFTPAAFIEICRQRLCTRTEDRTRQFITEAVKILKNSTVPLLKAIGYCCHPYCWWYKACPELKSCGKVQHKVIDDILSDSNPYNKVNEWDENHKWYACRNIGEQYYAIRYSEDGSYPRNDVIKWFRSCENVSDYLKNN